MRLRFAHLLMALMSTTACLGPQATMAQPAGNSSAPAPAVDFHFIPGRFSPEIGPDGNTLIFTAPSGLVVIDTGRHPAHVQQILDHAASERLPIVAIVNTHWHLDHTTGNLDIKADHPGVKVHATRAIEGALEGFLAPGITAAREQQDDPSIGDDRRARASRFLAAIDQGVLLPDVAVEGTLPLPVIGRDLELKLTHHAVSESDIWIWDPATRTVIAGDIVTLPVPLFDTACADGWKAAFEAIEEKPFERVVPGHGYIMNTDEFRLYRRAFDELIACAAGKSGGECAEGWLADAAPLLDKAAGEEFADKDWARAAATYYVDEVINSAEKQAQCLGSAPASP